jgi:hypothetical protein
MLDILWSLLQSSAESFIIQSRKLGSSISYDFPAHYTTRVAQIRLVQGSGSRGDLNFINKT